MRVQLERRGRRRADERRVRRDRRSSATTAPTPRCARRAAASSLRPSDFNPERVILDDADSCPTCRRSNVGDHLPGADRRRRSTTTSATSSSRSTSVAAGRPRRPRSPRSTRGAGREPARGRHLQRREPRTRATRRSKFDRLARIDRQQPARAGPHRRRGGPGQQRRDGRRRRRRDDRRSTHAHRGDPGRRRPDLRLPRDRPGQRPGRRRSRAATSARSSSSAPTAGCRSSTARAAASTVDDDGRRHAAPATQLQHSPGRIDPANAAFTAAASRSRASSRFNGHHAVRDRQPLQLQGRRRPAVRPLPAADAQLARRSATSRRTSCTTSSRRSSPPTRTRTWSCSATSTTSSSPRRVTILEGARRAARPDRHAAAERALQLRLRGQLAGARPHPGQRRLFDAAVAYDVVHVNAEFADQASDHDPQVVAASRSTTPPAVDAGGPYRSPRAVRDVTRDRHRPEGGAATYAWDLDDNGTSRRPARPPSSRRPRSTARPRGRSTSRRRTRPATRRSTRRR